MRAYHARIAGGWVTFRDTKSPQLLEKKVVPLRWFGIIVLDADVKLRSMGCVFLRIEFGTLIGINAYYNRSSNQNPPGVACMLLSETRAIHCYMC